MSTNFAAVALEQGQPLDVQEAPYPTAGPHEIVVHTRAIALNPVDYAAQLYGAHALRRVPAPGARSRQIHPVA